MLGTTHSKFKVQPQDFTVQLAKAGFLYSAVFAGLGLALLFYFGYEQAGVVSLLLALCFTFSAVPYLIKANQLENDRIQTARSSGRSL